jgi:cell division septum initiation protein DivIVA
MTKEDYDIEVAKEYTNLQERIEELEKENAELEKDKDYFSDALDKQIDATLKLQKENEEAKNLIEELASSLSVVGECDEEECELIDKARKFINKPIF